MQPEDSPPRRGRPARPTDHSIGAHLRRLRTDRGLTIRELALLVGLPSSSAAYISQLEAGTKIPNEGLAHNLARVLSDDSGIFRLWSQLGRRSDRATAAGARRQLANLLGDPSLMHESPFTHPTWAYVESAQRSLALRRETRPPSLPAVRMRLQSRLEVTDFTASAEVTPMIMQLEVLAMQSTPMRAQMRLPSRVPILPEGVDPDLRGGTEHEPTEWLHLEPDALRGLPLSQPFAWRVTGRSLGRVSHLIDPDDLVVITREVGNVLPHEIHLVRLPEGIALALLMHNGRELLVLPDAGRDDFLVLSGGEANLEQVIIGRVATVVRH